MKQFSLVLVGFALFLCLLNSGCSSGPSSSGSSQTQTGLQFTSPTTTPTIDAAQSISVTVNEPVTWSLQGGDSSPVGSLSNQTSSGATYNAPSASAVTGPVQVTVVATLVSDTTQSVALGVLINPVVTAVGSFSANENCQYDPINSIGQSNGTVGVAYANHANVPPSAVGGTGPYTWTVSSGTLPTGLTLNFAPKGSTPSEAYLTGTPVSAGCSQVVLQVTDATGVSATTLTNYIVITPPALKIQVPNYTDAYSLTPYPPTALSVTGGVSPYLNWSVSSGASQLPPGMALSPDATNTAAAVISGTPNQPCNANSCVGYNPIVQVEDSQLPYPAYGTATLNMFQWPGLPANPCSGQGGTTVANLGNMQGSYAFMLRGFDANGPVAMAGSFAADGSGNVTGGVEDVMRSSGSQTNAAITGGAYSIIEQNAYAPFEQSGCLTLSTASGTTTFAISLGGCSTSSDPNSGACVANSQGGAGLFTTGRLIEFDDTTGTGTRASGVLRLQNSSALSAGLSGPYAFGLSGWDFSGGRYAGAGSFSASTGTLSGVAADINDAGTVQSSLSGGSGNVGTFDATTGRADVSLNVGNFTFADLAVYTVSANEAFVLNTGALSTTNPIVSGEAISTGNSFSNSSLQDAHIFRTVGMSAAGPDPSIGILQFDGEGDVTGTQYENQAGTIGTTSLSGTYTVNATTGRFQLLGALQNQNIGDHPLVGYVIPVPSTLTRKSCVDLASCVTGFLISTDATAQAGELEFQTSSTAPPPPFSTVYFSGYYFFGTDESMDGSTSLVAGASLANPNGSKYEAIQSASNPSSYCMQPNCVLLLPNETLTASGSYSVSSNGAATIGGETVAVTNGNVTFYIDESPLNAHPSVTIVEQ